LIAAMVFFKVQGQARTASQATEGGNVTSAGTVFDQREKSMVAARAAA
jgi:hypothetical protein